MGPMLSVIIATHDCERLLVPTLAALVAGALAGLVREVIVADAGSRDETAKVADIAGCRIVVNAAPIGARLKSAAAGARGPWLLFLKPGSIPDATWVGEASRFVQAVGLAAGAGAFGRTNMKRYLTTAAVAGFAMLLAAAVSASAAEIKVISSNALKTVLEELAPAFEKATEHKLVIQWGAAVPLKAEIEKGASFDLAILTVAGIDDLIKQGKLAGATRAVLAKSGAGVAVRKGAPKPDISTVDAFKRALVNAKSVAYVEQGGTGIYLKE